MLTFLALIFLVILPFFYCLSTKKVENFLFYIVLIYWIPVFIPVGWAFDAMTIPEFFIYAGAAYCFLEGKKHTKFMSPMIQVGFALMFIGGILSTIFSIDNTFLLMGFRQTIVTTYLMFYIFKHVKMSPEMLVKLFKIFITTTVVFLFVLLLYPKTNSFLDLRMKTEEGRLGGEYLFFGHFPATFYEATLGALLGYLIPVFIAFQFYLFKEREKKRRFYFINILALIGFLVLTGGRTGWVATVFGTAIVIFGAINSNRSKFPIIVSIITVFLIVILTYSYLAPILRIDESISGRLNSFINVSEDANLQVRIFQWGWAFETFLSNPFGIGFWNFQSLTKIFGGNSTWLNYLLDLGVIGFLGFILIYIKSIKSAFTVQRSMNQSFKIIILGIYSGLLCFSLGATTESFIQSGAYCQIPIWTLINIALHSKRIGATEG